MTVCALAIAMCRDEKLTGTFYQEKLNYLHEIMKMEGHDSDTFKACMSMFDTYRFTVTDNENYKSLIRKYAGA